MSTKTNACGDVQAGLLRPDEITVDLLVTSKSATADAVPSMTGTYTVGGNTLRAVVIIRSYDAQCGVGANAMTSASSGAVELTSIENDTFSGRFDVVLETGDHVTGDFDPQPCAALSGSAASACGT